MKKIGLIIQGPLDSYGRCGAAADVPAPDLEKVGGLVHYDCRPNIQRVVNQFGALFDKIVVSTWEDQVKPGDGWEGVILSTAPDPGSADRNSTLYTHKVNNKFRQFVSMQQGLRELEKNGSIDFVVKMRTDQYVDLRLLLDSVRKLSAEENGSDVIYVPFIHRTTFLISDHYFAGNAAAMKKFCNAVLAYDLFEFISCVHREMILKHAYALYRDTIGVPDWAYFPWWPPHGACRATKKIFDYMLHTAYHSLDASVLRSAEWRGSAFNERYLSSRLAAQATQPKRYALPALISIDWNRYWRFLALTRRRKPMVSDEAVAFIGRFGWRSWNKFKKIVRAIRRSARFTHSSYS